MTASVPLPWNPLSARWNEGVSEPSDVSKLALAYVGGMVGYAVALPLRVTVVALEIIGFLYSAVFDRSQFRTRAIVLGGAVGELISAVIGMHCPPLAYKIDAWIWSHDTYAQESMGPFGDRLEEARAEASGLDGRDAANYRRLRSFGQFLNKSVQEVQKWFENGVFAMQGEGEVRLLTMVALLIHFRDHSDVDFLAPLVAYLKEHPLTDVSPHERALESCLSQFESREALVNALIQKAMFDEALDTEEYKEGKKDELKEATDGLSSEFDALYQIFYGIVGSILSKPSFCACVLRLSGVADLE